MKWCHECTNYNNEYCDALKTEKKSHSRGDKCKFKNPIQETLE